MSNNDKDDKKVRANPVRLGAVAVDPKLVSADRLAALKKLAAEEVQKELAKDHEDALLEQFKLEARQANVPQEELQEFQVDLPGNSQHIMLDGIIYLHGRTYTVSRNVAETMADIQARGWDHENEIGGANRDHYRKPRNPRISQNSYGGGSASLMRV